MALWLELHWISFTGLFSEKKGIIRHTQKKSTVICIPQQATFWIQKINIEGTVYMLFKTFKKKVFQADFSKLAEELKWIIPTWI